MKNRKVTERGTTVQTLPVLGDEQVAELEGRWAMSPEKVRVDERRRQLQEDIDLKKACHSY